tara:strand:+ start:1177 stop:2139 length:963 start_codon:yes stop_codon:yes gene_type:complete
MSGFLNNSGDIILDAVLTDAGRERLARGDGSFEIDKFALSDDEINYELYDTTAGTAYADLNILRTPIMEAFTNSNSSVKHQLLTIEREDLLYLPMAKLNTTSTNESVGAGKPLGTGINFGLYVILCTDNSYDAYKTLPDGFIDGRKTSTAGAASQLVKLDHGLDTVEISFTKALEDDLSETQWVIQIDDRFGKIVEPSAGGIAAEDAIPSSVDENNIATYYVVDGAFFAGLPEQVKEASVISGPRGEKFQFGIRCSDDLANSTFFFDKFGTTYSSFFSLTNGTVSPPGLTNALTIDTTVRISGVKTGISIDVPLRFVREA